MRENNTSVGSLLGSAALYGGVGYLGGVAGQHYLYRQGLRRSLKTKTRAIQNLHRLNRVDPFAEADLLLKDPDLFEARIRKKFPKISNKKVLKMVKKYRKGKLNSTLKSLRDEVVKEIEDARRADVEVWQKKLLKSVEKHQQFSKAFEKIHSRALRAAAFMALVPTAAKLYSSFKRRNTNNRSMLSSSGAYTYNPNPTGGSYVVTPR